jgi:hypothetical protein
MNDPERIAKVLQDDGDTSPSAPTTPASSRVGLRLRPAQCSDKLVPLMVTLPKALAREHRVSELTCRGVTWRLLPSLCDAVS